jgi:replicative DNA helicase
VDTFDRRLGAFDPYYADYYAILAGGNSDGKSALARQCVAANLKAGKRVAMFCLETTVQDTMRQLAGHLSKVNLRELESEPHSRQQAMLEQLGVVEKWAGQRFWCWDDVHTVEDLIGKVRWMLAEHGMPDLVVIDYAQLLRTARRLPSREQEVAHVSMMIRRFASELQTQFLVLAQIARDVLREGRRPTKNDLRESQALVNDCDRLVMMYYPKETCRGEDNALANVERELHLLQEKSRNGKLGSVPVWFRKQLLRFDPLSLPEEEVLRTKCEHSGMAQDAQPTSKRQWKNLS